MGTKGVVVIQGYSENIVGVTSDGTPNSMQVIALWALHHARKLRVLTKCKKGDVAAITRVLEAVVADPRNDGWAFLDDPKNPEWVSNTLVFDFATNSLTHYEGYDRPKPKVR
jgi:hypothetical protein